MGQELATQAPNEIDFSKPEEIKRLADKLMSWEYGHIHECIREMPAEVQVAVARELINLAQPAAAAMLYRQLDSENEKVAQKAAIDLLDRGPFAKGQGFQGATQPLVVINFRPESVWGNARGEVVDAEFTPSTDEDK